MKCMFWRWSQDQDSPTHVANLSLQVALKARNSIMLVDHMYHVSQQVLSRNLPIDNKIPTASYNKKYLKQSYKNRARGKLKPVKMEQSKDRKDKVQGEFFFSLFFYHPGPRL